MKYYEIDCSTGFCGEELSVALSTPDDVDIAEIHEYADGLAENNYYNYHSDDDSDYQEDDGGVLIEDPDYDFSVREISAEEYGDWDEGYTTTWEEQATW